MMRGRRGSGMVEFALGFSLMAVFFIGLAQLVYSVIVLNQVTAAVRSGARYASTLEFDEPAHAFTDKVRSFVAYGTSGGETEGEPLAPGLHPRHVSVTWSRDAAGAPETITVSLESYEVPFFFGDRRLDGRPKATVRYAGSWAPSGRTLH